MQDAAFIMKFLDRQPVLMPNTMWSPLRRYRLIQTPSEYRNDKFPNAQVAVEADTTYGKEHRDSESIIEQLEAQINRLREQNRELIQQQAEQEELRQEKEQLRQEKEDLQSNNEELQQSKELLQTINDQLRLKHEDRDVHSRTALDDNTSEMKAMKKLVTEAKAAERVAQDKATQASELLRAARAEVKRAKEDKKKAENGEETMMKTLQRLLDKRKPTSDDDAENRRRGNLGGGGVETEHGEGERAAKRMKVEDVIVLD
jgi:DNA repair exonuclease SbcCD ATPase subunit